MACKLYYALFLVLVDYMKKRVPLPELMIKMWEIENYAPKVIIFQKLTELAGKILPKIRGYRVVNAEVEEKLNG